MQDFISTKGLEQANPQRQTRDRQLSGAGGREGSGGWGVTGSGAGLGVTLSPLPRMHFPPKTLDSLPVLGNSSRHFRTVLGERFKQRHRQQKAQRYETRGPQGDPGKDTR